MAPAQTLEDLPPDVLACCIKHLHVCLETTPVTADTATNSWYYDLDLMPLTLRPLSTTGQRLFDANDFVRIDYRGPRTLSPRGRIPEIQQSGLSCRTLPGQSTSTISHPSMPHVMLFVGEWANGFDTAAIADMSWRRARAHIIFEEGGVTSVITSQRSARAYFAFLATHQLATPPPTLNLRPPATPAADVDVPAALYLLSVSVSGSERSVRHKAFMKQQQTLLCRGLMVLARKPNRLEVTTAFEDTPELSRLRAAFAADHLDTTAWVGHAVAMASLRKGTIDSLLLRGAGDVMRKLCGGDFGFYDLTFQLQQMISMYRNRLQLPEAESEDSLVPAQRQTLDEKAKLLESMFLAITDSQGAFYRPRSDTLDIHPMPFMQQTCCRGETPIFPCSCHVKCVLPDVSLDPAASTVDRPIHEGIRARLAHNSLIWHGVYDKRRSDDDFDRLDWELEDLRVAEREANMAPDAHIAYDHDCVDRLIDRLDQGLDDDNDDGLSRKGLSVAHVLWRRLKHNQEVRISSHDTLTTYALPHRSVGVMILYEHDFSPTVSPCGVPLWSV